MTRQVEQTPTADDYRVLYTREAPKRRIVVHFVRHRRAIYKMGGP